MIASHYAAPVKRRIVRQTTLFEERPGGTAIAELNAGDPFELLDDSLGWAWGYAGSDRRVGYVCSESLKA